MQRAKGFLADSSGADLPSSSLLLQGVMALSPAAETSLPASFSRRSMVVEHLFQGRASSCVPHALVQSVRLRWMFEQSVEGGGPSEGTSLAVPPLISRRQLYWGMRARANLQGADVGGYPSDAVATLNEGYALESDCPYDDSLVSVLTPPGPDVYRLSEDQRAQVEAHEVTGRGISRIEELKRLLWGGYFPCLGIECDQAFEDYYGMKKAWNYVGPTLGGHYVVMTGWTPEGVEILNSWRSWGEDGFGLVGNATLVRPEIVNNVRAIALKKRPVVA